MAFSPASCPACKHDLPADFINRPDPESCPNCRKKVQIQVFPTLFRKQEPLSFQSGKKEGDASCFHHPGNPAVAVCDFCGVLLCGICDLPINEKHICPPCFDKPENKKGLHQSDRSRILYDGIALALATFPLILFWVASFFTSLATIFICIRYWNSPGSVIPRSKIRYILAIIFALLQISCWLVGIFFLAKNLAK